jgi:EAL domain-containing protein (putative c-di-GMP-specific phosphodiesterase class I)/GGDEF domain-containing protein
MIRNENRAFKKSDIADILVWAKNLLSDLNDANQNRSQAPTRLIGVTLCLTGALLSMTGLLIWLDVLNLNQGIKNPALGFFPGVLIVCFGFWLLYKKDSLLNIKIKYLLGFVIIGYYCTVALMNGMVTVIFLPVAIYLIHLIMSPNVSLVLTLSLLCFSFGIAMWDQSMALYISARIIVCSSIIGLLMQRISRQIISSNKKTIEVANKISKVIITLNRDLEDRIQDIEYARTHDLATQLSNESGFIEHLHNILSSDARPCLYQITCLDVKGIEDSKVLLSQSEHASFIARIAEKIHNYFGNHTFISRSSDTSFLIFTLLDDDEVNHLSDQLLIDEMRKPMWLHGQFLPTNVFIGIDTASNNCSDLSLVINNARNAALWAELNGNSRLARFQEKMQTELENRIALTSSFLDGLDAGQFELEYQPIISLGHIKKEKVEALIRWNHPTRGRVTPDQFIDLLDADQTIRMTEWVLSKSAEQLKQWHLNHGIWIEVSVNIPSAYLIDILKDINGLHNRLDSFVNKYGSFVFEITEKSLLVVGDDVLSLLEMLRKQGIGISLDDFGTGYSSIKQLGALPLDYLKIDKSLIDFIDASSSSATIVGYIVRLSHELNLKVIAEGVENESQNDALAWAGCDFAQGYLFSKPIAANQIPVFYGNA